MAKDLVKMKNEAMQLTVKGKLDKALKLYQTIVKKDPKDIKTWVKIGDVYKKMGRKDQAIDIYVKAATSYAVSGYLMQAISVNKMILEIDPNHGETQENLAKLYAQKEEKEAGKSKNDGGTAASGARGASSSVLDMLKKKPGDAKPAEPAKPEQPKPEPEPEAPAEEKPAEPVVEEEELVEEAEEVAAAQESTGSGSGGMPQFDALDLDLADDLFDEIMNQEAVVIETEDEAAKILGQLPQIPLFSYLNQDEFMGIVEKISLRRFDVGDKIIKEGEAGEAFYIIARGSATVSKTDPKGKDVKIATIEEGEFFGEFAFFSESVRHASVTVASEMECLEIDRADLAELVGQYPRIQEVMKDFYKQRLIGTMLKISPFFQPLSEEDRDKVLDKFEYIEADTGTVLIKQGQEGEGLFVITQGDIAVTVKGEDGQPVEVARLREGDFFGEISLITDKPTTANCLAVKSSILYKLPKTSFKELIAEYPQILEVTADYADARVKETKKMITGGEALQAAGMV